MAKEQRVIIKDPLYKQIFVETEHKKFMDSKEFQRLRHIKQTSFVDFVYPNANHTRFSHSLGAYHLMKKVLNNGLVEAEKKEKNNMILAAMLHDIGHGPFSHFWEKLFPHFDHEEVAQKILRKWKLDDVADILIKKNPLSNIISSSIDVDKLDYMARDSYFAGVSYGVAEVDFIIQHMYVKDNKLIIKPSALSSVEDLITQRVNLFKTVYFHKFAIEYDFLLSNIFKRARDIMRNKKEIFVDKNLKAFFDKKDTIDNLLALNDSIIIYHVYRWAEHKDEILSHLSNMFIERKKFKVINKEHKKVDAQKIRKKVSEKYDPKYYFGHICLPIKIIQTPIYVEIENKLKKIEEISELIKFYKKQKWYVEYIIYPSDIEI